jgi:hypothetical protein
MVLKIKYVKFIIINYYYFLVMIYQISIEEKILEKKVEKKEINEEKIFEEKFNKFSNEEEKQIIPKNIDEIKIYFTKLNKLVENKLFEKKPESKNIFSSIENHIFDYEKINKKLNRCPTISGKYIFNYLLTNPDYNNVKYIKNDYLILDKRDNLEKAKNIIKKFIKYENIFYNIFNTLDNEAIELYSKLYLNFEKLKFMNILNNNANILFIINFYSFVFVPLLNVFSPFVFFLGLFISIFLIFFRNTNDRLKQTLLMLKNMVSYIFKNNIIKILGFKKIIALIICGIIYLYNYFSSNYYLLKQIGYYFKIYNYLYLKVNATQELISLINDLIYQFSFISPLFNKIKDEYNPPDIITKNKYLFFGENCVLFKKIYENKKFIYNGLLLVGYLDTIINLYQIKDKYNLVLNKFCKKNILFKDFYHPILVESSSLEKNDLSINNNIKNICISGPNASGKSVFLKTLLVNLNFCYSFGLSFSNRAIIPKYDKVFILINIHDTIGSESFYQAQITQLIKLINVVDNNKSKKYLAIMDEVLNSTNYVAAVSIIYALVEYLIKLPNLTLIFATHYFKVTELEEIYPDRIKNFNLLITQEEGFLTYLYKFQRGKCLVNNAFDILKRFNFPDEIICRSLEICKDIEK